MDDRRKADPRRARRLLASPEKIRINERRIAPSDVRFSKLHVCTVRVRALVKRRRRGTPVSLGVCRVRLDRNWVLRV
ncbi:UNVERIFIED_CONTAM: hypothetical protein K2H54_016348 [Gekko kuhli]